MAEMLISNFLLNIVLSTPYTKFMGIDIKNFYLNTPMARYEYMRPPINITPQDIIGEYQLMNKVENWFIVCEIQQGIYGLPQAVIISNKLLT